MRMKRNQIKLAYTCRPSAHPTPGLRQTHQSFPTLQARDRGSVGPPQCGSPLHVAWQLLATRLSPCLNGSAVACPAAVCLCLNHNKIQLLGSIYRCRCRCRSLQGCSPALKPQRRSVSDALGAASVQPAATAAWVHPQEERAASEKCHAPVIWGEPGKSP